VAANDQAPSICGIWNLVLIKHYPLLHAQTKFVQYDARIDRHEGRYSVAVVMARFLNLDDAQRVERNTMARSVTMPCHRKLKVLEDKPICRTGLMHLEALRTLLEACLTDTAKLGALSGC